MLATHDQKVIALFSGEPVAPGYRGRRSSPPGANRLGGRIAMAFVAAMIGFTTAAAAITIRHSNPTERPISAGANLIGGIPGVVGFEAALY